jgi:hypothetical protein
MDPRDSCLRHHCGLRLSLFGTVAKAWLKSQGNTKVGIYTVASKLTVTVFDTPLPRVELINCGSNRHPLPPPLSLRKEACLTPLHELPGSPEDKGRGGGAG